MTGPTIKVSIETQKKKYLGEGEDHARGMARIANHLSDNDDHYHKFYHLLLDQKFLPAGRVQSASGSPREVTAFNCFVSGTIDDSMIDILNKVKEAGLTMQLGGGIGYDFSTLRPRGNKIVTLDSKASGPLSFMEIFDALCDTISSAGHRRGAQMGVLRVDHPDIEEFIEAKCNKTKLTKFNISIGVTDKFMQAVVDGTSFELVFEGVVHKKVDARSLFEKIMRATWDWAEPGVLYIDKINRKNNLWHCEKIAATNPCGEQPLPPYGACLLGSVNLAQFIVEKRIGSGYAIALDQIEEAIPTIIRAMDNVIDRTNYPLLKQEQEAKNKRRMGIGVTGLANALEICGFKYGSNKAKKLTEKILRTIAIASYNASIDLAIEKGAYPLWDVKALESEFIQSVIPKDVQERMRMYGIRNSHLLSIAPTGTISLCANNISSGLEPPFLLEYERTIQEFDGEIKEIVKDFAYEFYGVKGVTANELTPKQHVDMLNICSKWVDSACSKTINVGDDVGWDEFKDIYMQAWKGGASGCTTFRAAGKRYGILNAIEETDNTSIKANWFQNQMRKIFKK